MSVSYEVLFLFGADLGSGNFNTMTYSIISKSGVTILSSPLKGTGGAQKANFHWPSVFCLVWCIFIDYAAGVANVVMLAEYLEKELVQDYLTYYPFAYGTFKVSNT